MESKEVLAKLQEMGEFVRSASSTVEAPVVRKLVALYPDAKPAEEKKPVKKAAAKKTAASKKTAEVNPELAAELAAELGVDLAALKASRDAEKVAAEEAKAAASEAAPAPATPTTPAAPRPGNNPFSTGGAVPRPPRPGNNPFSTGGAVPRPPQRPQGTGAPRPGMAGARPGSVRPGFAARPGAPRPAGAGTGSGNYPPRTGGAPTSSGPYRSQGSTGAPGGAAGGPQRPGGGPNRPPGRGGTAGAFGKNASKSSKRKQKSRKALREEFDNMQAPQLGGAVIPHGDGKTNIRMRRGASLADFAEKIGADPAALVAALFHLGEMVTATQSVDADTFEILGAQLGYVIEVVSPEEEDRELLQGFDIDLAAEMSDFDEENLTPRPPVVTVMGHVDHGKTSLLDAIRKTEVIKGEAGGITQHIGAYQIHHDHDGVNRAITFIDTPGHEAFTAMRARGAKVTDIAVLVVAADDGIMPQTIEALNHAQAAGVPIVVAVNKVDKEGADPTKVRGQLTEYGLVPEEYGGETIFVDVSAKDNINIDELINSILLTADAGLDLRANPTQDAQGVAIEAHLDRGRGPVATVLVQRGTLRPGVSIVIGDAFGRVRAMLDENGDTVEEAGPARAVQVLGLTSVPDAGETFLVVDEDRTARQIAQSRQARERNAQLAARRGRHTLEDVLKTLEMGEIAELKIIIKGDVSGSVEALEDALLNIDIGDENVSLRVIHRGVGAITENDVSLAAASDALIIGFNVRPEGKSRELSERLDVEIRFYNVIYGVIDDIESSLKGMRKAEYEEVELGSAEVRDVFRSSKFGNIAGCMVIKGDIKRKAKARLIRDGAVVAAELSIDTLRRFKDDATEVREGFECGIGLGSYNDIKVGDIIETFEMREKVLS